MQDFDVIRFKFDDFKQKVERFKHSDNLNPNSFNKYKNLWEDRMQFFKLSLEIYNFIKKDTTLFEEFNRIKFLYKSLLFSQEYNDTIDNLHRIVNNYWLSYTDKDKQQEDFINEYKNAIDWQQCDYNSSYILKTSGMPDLTILLNKELYLKPKNTIHPKDKLQKIIYQYQYMCLPQAIYKKEYKKELDKLYGILEEIINMHIEEFNIFSYFSELYKEFELKSSLEAHHFIDSECFEVSSCYMVDCTCRVLDDLQYFYLSNKYQNAKQQNYQAEVFLNDKLTKREQEIAKLLFKDMEEMEIANELNITINTVETHRKSIYRKLNVASKAALIKKLTPRG